MTTVSGELYDKAYMEHLRVENKKLREKYDVAVKVITHLRSSPFIVGEFFQEDSVKPRKTIMICPMEGSDALYDYVLKENNNASK